MMLDFGLICNFGLFVMEIFGGSNEVFIVRSSSTFFVGVNVFFSVIFFGKYLNNVNVM